MQRPRGLEQAQAWREKLAWLRCLAGKRSKTGPLFVLREAPGQSILPLWPRPMHPGGGATRPSLPSWMERSGWSGRAGQVSSRSGPFSKGGCCGGETSKCKDVLSRPELIACLLEFSVSHAEVQCKT